MDVYKNTSLGGGQRKAHRKFPRRFSFFMSRMLFPYRICRLRKRHSRD